MRIGIVCPYSLSLPGGVQNQVLSLARSLRRRGHEVRVLAPCDGPPPELGDILICPEAAEEPLTTLAVHGLLHLVGYDHEVDDGEMLALQDDIVDAAQFP